MTGDPGAERDDPLAGVALDHQRIETNGVELHVVAAGPADGPLAVCLHGFPEFWYEWRRTIPALVEAGYRVLVPDQRGYNVSEKPPGVAAYGLDDLRDDVLGLIEAEGRDSAHVVGHDWGAMVAWYAAMTRPEWVDRLVTINVPHPVVFRRFFTRDPRQMARSWYAVFFQIPWLSTKVVARNDHAFLVRALRDTSREGTFSEAELERYREAYRQPGATDGMLNWYRAAARKRPNPRSGPRIEPPTLLVWGENDSALRTAMARPSIDLCADGRLETFPDASHWVVHEEPRRVNELILEHLGGESHRRSPTRTTKERSGSEFGASAGED